MLLPLEESYEDDSNLQFITMYLPYWIDSGTEQSLRTHFLNNDKLVDNFDQIFWTLWGNS